MRRSRSRFITVLSGESPHPSRPQKKEAALAGGFCEKLTYYFRRRKIISAAAPRPANAKDVGSGILPARLKLLQPGISGVNTGPAGPVPPRGFDWNRPERPLT